MKFATKLDSNFINGQVAMKRSPELFKPYILYRHLLKAGHFPGDTYGGHFWPQGHNFLQIW